MYLHPIHIPYNMGMWCLTRTVCEFQRLVIKNACKYFSTHHFNWNYFVSCFCVRSITIIWLDASYFLLPPPRPLRPSVGFARLSVVSVFVYLSCSIFFQFSFPFRQPTSADVVSWEVTPFSLSVLRLSPLLRADRRSRQGKYGTKGGRFISLIETIYLVLAFGSALDCNDLDKVCLLSKFEHKYCANSCRCMFSPGFPTYTQIFPMRSANVCVCDSPALVCPYLIHIIALCVCYLLCWNFLFCIGGRAFLYSLALFPPHGNFPLFTLPSNFLLPVIARAAPG